MTNEAAVGVADVDRAVSRVDTAEACARLLTGPAPEGIVAVRTTALPDPDDILFAEIPPSGPIPIDYVLSNPKRDFPSLYSFSRLRARHPVRVSIPLVDGFEEAFTLATALGLCVQIVVQQPCEAQIDLLEWALDRYLHCPSVVAEVEFFNSVLLCFASDVPVTLWEVEELERRSRTHAECSECEFEGVCAGYFKYPDPAYACGPVRRLFSEIAAAARELRQDIAAYVPPERET